MIYFTSDTHVGHRKILSYCPESRAVAGGDIEKMREIIIDNINARVGVKDTLYILGDVTFTAAHKKIEEFLLSIKCQNLHLIIGNHDQAILSNKRLHGYFKTMKYYDEIKIDGDRIIMSHYPIESWNHKFHGSFHLHGHTHSRNDYLNTDEHRGRLKYFPRRFDVGIDSRTDMMPWSWDEIRKFCLDREAENNFNDVMQQGL